MRNSYKLYVLGAFVGLSAACTKVDVCDETTHPHVASLKVGYNWGAYDTEKPEQMHLVAARILNTYHCCFTTRAADGAFLVPSEEPETPVTPDEPETPVVPDEPETPVTPDEPEASVASEEPETPTVPEDPEEPEKPKLVAQPEASILGGEYFMMAFTKDDERLEVVNLKEFLDDPSVSVRDIRLRNMLLEDKDYPNLSQEENVTDEDKMKAWVDFNPGYKFVSNPGRVFIDRVNYVKFTTGTTYSQPFTLSTLTQRINFSFSIEFDNTDAEETLTVNGSNMYMEIAGVIPEVGLADGLLYTNSLRRMFLTNEKVQTQSGANGTQSVVYNGYINAFGLMPGPDSYAISGPGVLRLAMKVTLASGGSRVIRTSLNLSKEINDANLSKATGYSNVRERLVDEGTVRISRSIHVNTKKVIAGNSDGVTGWDTAFVDVDI